jgi:hypothetical protein
LVNDSPEACIVAAQKLFPKEWGYKGTFYTKGNHVWFKEAETVGENFKDFARVMVLSVLTLGIYFVYLNLKPASEVAPARGAAHVLVAQEGNLTRLEVRANKPKYQRRLEEWVEEKFPTAQRVAPEEETPVIPEEPSLRVKAASPQGDIPEQIEKLAKLKESGSITNEEFEAKKKDLLDRM